MGCRLLLPAAWLLAGCSSLDTDSGQQLLPGNYRLHLPGLTAASVSDARGALADDLHDLGERGFPRPAVDDGAWTLELLLRGRGRTFATVTWDLIVAGDGTADVIYHVDEGPEVELDDVHFEGNVALPSSQLRSLFLPDDRSPLGVTSTPYVESRVAAAVASTAALYLGAGFQRAEVGPARVSFSPDRAHASVVVPIIENLRYRVTRIEIRGETAVPAEALRREVDEFVGQPYFPQVGFAMRERLREKLGAAGYPDAVVTFAEQRDDGNGDVTLDFDVQAGPLVAIAAVRVAGTGRTEPGFVRERVALKPGDTWNTPAERDSYSTLHHSGLFKRVHIALETPDAAELAAAGTLPAGAEPRALAVDVEEGPQREYFVEPGYGSYEGPRLVAGYRDRNVFGEGLTFHTEGAISPKVKRVLAGLTDPWLFPGPDISGDVSVFAGERQEPSFDSHEVGTALTFGHDFDARNSAYLVYSLRRTSVSQIKVEDPSVVEASQNTIDVASLALTSVHDSRDDLFAPTVGTLARITTELGGTVLGGGLDFLRGRLEASRFWPLSPISVLAVSFRTGVIAPIQDTDEIPLQERFFNGGQDTVRSFREDELGPKDIHGNPTGGETFSVATIEWRHRLEGKLDGALFMDAGNVDTDYAEYFGLHGFGYALGTGLRYQLPVGPVRLDWGWNPFPDKGDDIWAIHLSVGMPF
ncbi:MAG TPA: BamA/TamA family outer membrane protein [Planctomycetota bacterium]|nr:BamA/TamA family outer membrane protein [Planctomycetota bacterium]